MTKEFKTSGSVLMIVAGALTGAFVIVLGNWLFGDLDANDFAVAIGFLFGDLTCLWTFWSRRHRVEAEP